MAIDLTNPQPLYRQIVADIKSRIAEGELKVSGPVGSHQQLAAQYNVSLITVKKALAELINGGFLYSRVGKGTFVAGRSPFVIHTRHKTIGIVLNDLKNPFFSLIVHGFEEIAHERGFNILLSTSSDRIEKEEIQIRRFRDLGVDGLLIASLSHLYRATPIICALHDEGFPYVMVSYIQDDDIFFVGTDHEHGAFLAAEHLIKSGRQKIAYINGEKGNLLGELRKQGYRRALEHYEHPVTEGLVFQLRLKGGEHAYRCGYEIGELVAELQDRADAFFVYNDLAALGFQNAVIQAGLRVPEDVAIVGFDNIERGRIAKVPLTTVAQPTEEIGQIAFQHLASRIQGDSPPTRTILQPQLIIRNSCGARKQSAIERDVHEPAVDLSW